MTPTVLSATWGDGLFVITGESRRHELAGQRVNALASDGHGGALAIVSGHSLRRRTSDGEWMTIATSEFPLACCAPVGDVIYIGTDDVRVLRMSAKGDLEQLRLQRPGNGSKLPALHVCPLTREHRIQARARDFQIAQLR